MPYPADEWYGCLQTNVFTLHACVDTHYPLEPHKNGCGHQCSLHVYYISHIFKTTCFQLFSNHILAQMANKRNNIIPLLHGATTPSGPGPPHRQGFMITDTAHSVGLLLDE
jgi:hypothetical protein